jgi:diguanylate cyclase (GGDEF)-like protein
MTTKFTEFLKSLQRGAGLITLLTAMLLSAMAAVVWAPAPIAERLVRDDIHAQAELWKRQVILQLDDAEHSFTNSIVSDHDQRFLHLLVQATDVYRFHLFNGQGLVFWSTDGGKVGYVEEGEYFHQKVAKGQIFYKTEEKAAWEIAASSALEHDIDAPHDHGIASPQDPAQHEAADQGNGHAAPGHHDHEADHVDEGKDHSPPPPSAPIDPAYLSQGASSDTRHVAEIYVPFMHNGHFDGAIEFYTDVTDMRASVMNRVRLLLSVIVGAVLITMISAGWMLHRNNSRHVAQLNRRNTKEREIIDQQLQLAREVQLLGELNEWLQSSHSLEELFQMVARFMTHILPNAEGSVYVYSNSRDVLDGSAKWNGGSVKPHIHPEECWGLRRGRTYEYGASEVDFVCDHAEPHDGRPYYCFPILAHGETVGLMHLRAAEGHEANFRQNKKLARMCAEQISMAIANVRMRDQLQDQSVRDPLTGLFNRRHMTETLRKAIGQSQNTGAPLSLIAVDVDHFKKFNDNHGHDAGDMILRAVGSALEKACDGDQVACRPGGEEFTLILPGVYDEDALIKAEALRQAVEAIALRYGDKTLPTVTISLGVSHYPQHGTMPQDLMRSADEALYEAKARGRNQVQQATGAAPEPRDATANPSPQRSEADAITTWQNDLNADQQRPDDDDKDTPPVIAAQ